MSDAWIILIKSAKINIFLNNVDRLQNSSKLLHLLNNIIIWSDGDDRNINFKLKKKQKLIIDKIVIICIF